MSFSNFDDFFKKAVGYPPFPYQRELAIGDEWPELLEVPTGAGKTAAAILAWLWRRRFHPKEQVRAKTPRRLVYCLPMRVLVEQTRSCAIRWLDKLGLLAGRAEFGRYVVEWDTQKIAVVTLMGGEVQNDWHEYPEHEVIVIGTQDMLLSRALNRGYAMAPQMWPVDFGLLNVDVLWVLDEVQLMGPGRTTSIQLQCFWDSGQSSYGLRQTLWMSATLGAGANPSGLPSWMETSERKNSTRTKVLVLRPSANDIACPEFQKRWQASKRLEVHLNQGNRAGWTYKDQDLINRIFEEATGGRLVLVFVNRVDRARRLYQKLQNYPAGGSGPEILLMHGRMRPWDRRDQEKRLQQGVPPGGRIVVSTQVLEAGVDVDADVLFTELCPWPSLVQRLGRLNRSGNKSNAVAIIFEPSTSDEEETRKTVRKRKKDDPAAPYDPEALEETRKRLAQLQSAHAGSLSPATLAALNVRLPLEGPVLRRFDLEEDLFGTEPDLSGGHTDVSAYVRGVDRDVDAYILWRRVQGDGAVSPDEQVPIHPDELCPVPFYEAKDAFKNQRVWILTLATGRRGGSAWRQARGSDILPGDTVMVDVSLGCYSETTGWDPGRRDAHPTVIVDRWEQDGRPLRAWVSIGSGKTPTLVELIDERVVGPRAREEDPRSFSRQWMELSDHLRRAYQEALRLAQTLGLPSNLEQAVARAALWHDVGKALERDINGQRVQPFQQMLRDSGMSAGGHPKPGVLYAKSNGRGKKPAGFRHEVASLLAFLQSDRPDDLTAFLILAHHGKVRLFPQPWDEDDPTDLCGVRTGDRIPAGAIPCVSGSAGFILNVDELFPSQNRRSWQGRVKRLLDEYGPFLLAYLEALVRVADWRAS